MYCKYTISAASYEQERAYLCLSREKAECLAQQTRKCAFFAVAFSTEYRKKSDSLQSTETPIVRLRFDLVKLLLSGKLQNGRKIQPEAL